MSVTGKALDRTWMDLCLLIVLLTSACLGPSLAQVDARAAQIAAGLLTTQAAQSPTHTPTRTPTRTATPTPTGRGRRASGPG